MRPPEQPVSSCFRCDHFRIETFPRRSRLRCGRRWNWTCDQIREADSCGGLSSRVSQTTIVCKALKSYRQAKGGQSRAAFGQRGGIPSIFVVNRSVVKLLLARSKFSNLSDQRIVDSYIEVLNMVLQDKDSIDFIVLLRFDVGYRVPILEWNMTLDTIGIPYMDSPENWDTCSMVSDLLFTFPSQYASAVIDALDWSGRKDTQFAHIGRGGKHKGHRTWCPHAYMHGPGHFVWQPLAERLGEEKLRVMDYRHHTSRDTIERTPSFLGIDRVCADDYFNGCPTALLMGSTNASGVTA